LGEIKEGEEIIEETPLDENKKTDTGDLDAKQ